MKMKNTRQHFLCVFATLLLCAGCHKDNWIDLGVGPEDLKSIPYRLIDITGKDTLPATHQDLVTLTMDLQSGKAQGAWTYLPIYYCYAPDVRNNLPTVMCVSWNKSDVIIAATDNVREILLRLRDDGKRAAIKGKAVGIYGGTPVVYVDDPGAKRKKE